MQLRHGATPPLQLPRKFSEVRKGPMTSPRQWRSPAVPGSSFWDLIQELDGAIYAPRWMVPGQSRGDLRILDLPFGSAFAVF